MLCLKIERMSSHGKAEKTFDFTYNDKNMNKSILNTATNH